MHSILKLAAAVLVVACSAIPELVSCPGLAQCVCAELWRWAVEQTWILLCVSIYQSICVTIYQSLPYIRQAGRQMCTRCGYLLDQKLHTAAAWLNTATLAIRFGMRAAATQNLLQLLSADMTSWHSRLFPFSPSWSAPALGIISLASNAQGSKVLP